jgi:predicted acylesterase/phospholipase RssA
MNKKLELKQNVTDIQTRQGNAHRNYFIGLALSGGGSRAANFGSAVLWELDRLGILQHVQYISTVSGGSLAGAYYVTFRDDPLKWNKQNLQQVMSQSFDLWSFLYGLNPIRWPQYFGTSYSRSHLLEDTFNRRVFEGRTFGNLRHGFPILLVNATNYSTGERFVFDNYSFNTLGSDLGALPISVGVTASAAFPGIFSVVTLKNFNEARHYWADSFNPVTVYGDGYPVGAQYLHLFDGGVSDNLGLDTLTQAFTYSGASNSRCLLILVDAYVPYERISTTMELNPRRFWDVLVDTNAIDATAILLGSKRNLQLKALGFNRHHWFKTFNRWTDYSSELKQLENNLKTTKDREDLKAYREDLKAYKKTLEERLARGEQYPTLRHLNEIDRPVNFLEDAPLANLGSLSTSKGTYEVVTRTCKIWHIALNHLTFLGASPELGPDPSLFYAEDYASRHEKNLNIPFDVFRRQVGHIATKFSISDSEVRNLDVTADLLVNETKSKNTICRWLEDITGQRCTVP